MDKYHKYCAAQQCEAQRDTHVDRVRLRKRIRDDVVDPLDSAPPRRGVASFRDPRDCVYAVTKGELNGMQGRHTQSLG